MLGMSHDAGKHVTPTGIGNDAARDAAPAPPPEAPPAPPEPERRSGGVAVAVSVAVLIVAVMLGAIAWRRHAGQLDSIRRSPTRESTQPPAPVPGSPAGPRRKPVLAPKETQEVPAGPRVEQRPAPTPEAKFRPRPAAVRPSSDQAGTERTKPPVREAEPSKQTGNPSEAKRPPQRRRPASVDIRDLRKRWPETMARIAASPDKHIEPLPQVDERWQVEVCGPRTDRRSGTVLIQERNVATGEMLDMLGVAPCAGGIAFDRLPSADFEMAVRCLQDVQWIEARHAPSGQEIYLLTGNRVLVVQLSPRLDGEAPIPAELGKVVAAQTYPIVIKDAGGQPANLTAVYENGRLFVEVVYQDQELPEFGEARRSRRPSWGRFGKPVRLVADGSPVAALLLAPPR
jgi:hypothetical protein